MAILFLKIKKKSFVWDLNGKKYLDLICAVGQNVLGYSNPLIDKKKFKRQLKKEIWTTLNCPEEVELSKQIIELHPWVQM